MSGVDTQLELVMPLDVLPEASPGDERFVDLYTRRLRRLVAIRRDHGDRMNEQGLRLLDRSIYSTFCDCRDLGAGARGRQLIEAVPVSVTPA